jgi:hypothetical protein
MDNNKIQLALKIINHSDFSKDTITLYFDDIIKQVSKYISEESFSEIKKHIPIIKENYLDKIINDTAELLAKDFTEEELVFIYNTISNEIITRFIMFSIKNKNSLYNSSQKALVAFCNDIINIVAAINKNDSEYLEYVFLGKTHSKGSKYMN